MPNPHQDHRKRVRKEFLENGLEHFPDHKVLEMLLFYSVPVKDTNELGHRLLEHFGSVSGVFDASYDMLTEVPGIGDASATLIKYVAGVIRRYMDDYSNKNNMIGDSKAAKEYMRYKFLCEQSECVYLACIGGNGKVILCRRIADGSPESVGITAALVVKQALRSNAVRVVLAHNHPNGMCIPSSKDLHTTSNLHAELGRVEIELFDHIIVASDGVFSMAENGMLPKQRYCSG